jgi:hypothetical protein
LAAKATSTALGGACGFGFFPRDIRISTGIADHRRQRRDILLMPNAFLFNMLHDEPHELLGDAYGFPNLRLVQTSVAVPA